MKKKFNTEKITNELAGASLFFTNSTTKSELDEKKPSPKIESPTHLESQISKKQSEILKSEQLKSGDTTVSRYHDTMTPRVHGVVIDLVRKAVKEFGKEAATHRFTEAEKKDLADLIYTYKNSGVRTSENEITRISVNFIVQDYRENGKNSVLHKILKALNE